MVRDESLELADQTGVQTERELSVDTRFECDEPQLVEPRNFTLGERLIGEIGKRRTAPESKRFPKLLGSLLGLPARERAASFCHQPREPRDVELLRPERQCVAGGPRL